MPREQDYRVIYEVDAKDCRKESTFALAAMAEAERHPHARLKMWIEEPYRARHLHSEMVWDDGRWFYL